MNPYLWLTLCALGLTLALYALRRRLTRHRLAHQAWMQASEHKITQQQTKGCHENGGYGTKLQTQNQTP